MTQVLPLVALFARALPLLGTLQGAWQRWSHSRPAFRETIDLIRTAEEGREPFDDAAVAAPTLISEIAVRNVTVRFWGREGAALHQVSLTFPARSVTSICGPSGAGKSTLADLLGGLIAPDSGGGSVDGVPLDGGLRRAWRERVTYVQQEPVLFTGTIRENLLWAESSASDARLLEVLRLASAEFAASLPEGLETLIGDQGKQFSGGERQRIVLARALLREPSLLILDEASSALDAENEAAIARAVRKLRERMTVIIIGHRGVLTEVADRFVRLEGGKVVETGERPDTANPS